jgi:hypothetical protein
MATPPLGNSRLYADDVQQTAGGILVTAAQAQVNVTVLPARVSSMEGNFYVLYPNRSTADSTTAFAYPGAGLYLDPGSDAQPVDTRGEMVVPQGVMTFNILINAVNSGISTENNTVRISFELWEVDDDLINNSDLIIRTTSGVTTVPGVGLVGAFGGVEVGVVNSLASERVIPRGKTVIFVTKILLVNVAAPTIGSNNVTYNVSQAEWWVNTQGIRVKYSEEAIVATDSVGVARATVGKTTVTATDAVQVFGRSLVLRRPVALVVSGVVATRLSIRKRTVVVSASVAATRLSLAKTAITSGVSVAVARITVIKTAVLSSKTVQVFGRSLVLFRQTATVTASVNVFVRTAIFVRKAVTRTKGHVDRTDANQLRLRFPAQRLVGSGVVQSIIKKMFIIVDD